MRAKKRALVEFKLYGSFLLIILLVACAGRVFTYKGSWVAEDDRISLQDGRLSDHRLQHTGILDTRYLYA
jgi:hypothetical protein